MTTGEKDHFSSGPRWSVASATSCHFVFGAQFVGWIPGSGSGVAVRACLLSSRQRDFRFLNWGGLPSLELWMPNLWASWPGQFRGLLWRGAWIHIVECSSEWATFCWNCNNRLGGPHSRDSWEIILKHQRLINKLNSTGTFRRELQASFFETPFQEILPKIIQKQGFLCSFWSYL